MKVCEGFNSHNIPHLEACLIGPCTKNMSLSAACINCERSKISAKQFASISPEAYFVSLGMLI